MRLSRGISRWSLLARAVSMCALLVASALPMAGGVDEAGAQPKSTLQAKPEGEMRWALYGSLSPVWFDPGEFQGLNVRGYPDIDALYRERALVTDRRSARRSCTRSSSSSTSVYDSGRSGTTSGRAEWA